MSDGHTNETRELNLDAIEARADVPALVAEVRQLREEIARRDADDEFRESCERWDSTFGDNRG